ncbi:1727_t:CDS:2, partial [Racocetra fulgida]
QLCNSYESDNPFDGPPVSYNPDKLRLARIDRLESIMNKVANMVGSIADSVGQLTNQLGRII